MTIYTFHCLDRKGASTTFELIEAVDDDAAHLELPRLFSFWPEGEMIEVARDGRTPYRVGRMEGRPTGARWISGLHPA